MMMKPTCGVLAFCWLVFCDTALAGHVFPVPYIPGGGWVTTITAYNDGDWTAAVTLRQSNLSGKRVVQSGVPVPTHSKAVWSQEDFYAEKPAIISTDGEHVRVKLTCQYVPTRSVSEIFLRADENATRWLIPNPRPGTYAALVIAAANLNNRPALVTLTAYGRGVKLRSASVVVLPGRSNSASSVDLWNLDNQKIDLILLESEVPICAPIAISASKDQARHRMAAGARIETVTGERRFYVPHISGDPWGTEITVYNVGSDPASFSLHQYDNTGVEIASAFGKAPAKGSVILGAGANGQLSGTGSALITARGDVAVLVSYMFGDSTPAGEFFAGGDVSRRWFLPNPMQVSSDWYGIAVQNPAASDANVVFRAYKDGQEVANYAVPICAGGKIAAYSEQVFRLHNWEFDMVSLESSQPVPMPLAITADLRQQRHLFYEGQSSSDAIRPRKWTVLFYDDADFTDAFNPARDFALEAWSGPNVDVLVLEDTANAPATLYYVNPNRSLARIAPPKAKNMGDPQTLYDFVMKAKTEFPAERYILAVYDHGFGWQGCCIDQTSNDYLTMDEMRQALGRAGGVDLMMFTAPCLMAELESVYQVRDWADIYISSEDLSTYMWFGTIQMMRGAISENPDVPSAELGRRIVDSIAQNIPANQARSAYRFADSYTISAVLPGKAAEVAANLDALALAWLAQPQRLIENAGLLKAVRGYADHSIVDLYDLLDQFAAIEMGEDMGRLIRKTQESVKACILAEAHGSANPGSHGLSVYLPVFLETGYHPLYDDPSFHLDFAADTRWPDLIKLLKSSNVR